MMNARTPGKRSRRKVVVENFILIGVFLILGMLFRRLKAFPRDSAQVLNIFVVYVSLPALVLLKVPQLNFTHEVLVAACMPWGMLLLSVVLLLLAARMFHWSRSVTGVLMLIVPLGNTSFMGVPMIQAFYGNEAIPYALIYDQLGSFMVLSTYGSVILALYGREGSVNVAGVAKRVLLFPPFLALLVALASRPFAYPPVLLHSLENIATTLTPLVMVAIGFQLNLRLRPGLLAPLSYGMAVKLLVAPLTALLICRVLNLHGMVADVSVLEAGMPPMVTAGALAVTAGLDAELSVAMVGLGIFLSFGTLPLIYLLL